MEFVKMHGLGNDYIYVYLPRGDEGTDWPTVARRVSHRHYGVGSDGLILVLPSDRADFRMRMFNADGSEAQMCGNGMRCLARFVYDRGLTQKQELAVETLAGIIRPRLVVEGGKVTAVEVDMGVPRLRRADIPMVGPPGDHVIGELLVVDGVKFPVTCLSLGNPHCVIFVEDVWQVEVEHTGPSIEHHPAFPERTNVEFVQVLNQQELAMRIWERGSGITMASGTGATASAVAAVLAGRCQREVKVHQPGGTLEIVWRDDGHAWHRGPAEEICTGVFTSGLTGGNVR
ncbi:MAG: diaminopimelate epimerase [Bacillota bacterium]